MKRTGRRVGRRRLAAIATSVLVLAGAAGAIAAGGGDGKSHHSQRRAVASSPRVTRRDLRAAASYLGVPPAELAGELSAGKSLDEVAAATPGKSSAGIVQALTSEKRLRLGKLSDTVAKRASSEASGHPNSVGEVRRLARAAEGSGSAARVLAVAAAYLGMSQEKLEGELRGRTLAEVAAATKGKSVTGLEAALSSPRRERLNAAAGTHRMSPARIEAVNARLARRVSALVNRRFPAS
jgi:hypothetical protein